MKHIRHFMPAVLSLTPLAALHAADARKPQSPNVVLMVADDKYASFEQDARNPGGIQEKCPEIRGIADHGELAVVEGSCWNLTTSCYIAKWT
jgi:hypothetical protein